MDCADPQIAPNKCTTTSALMEISNLGFIKLAILHRPSICKLKLFVYFPCVIVAVHIIGLTRVSKPGVIKLAVLLCEVLFYTAASFLNNIARYRCKM